MRVTDKIVFRQSIYDLNKARSKLFNLQSQGATGKKFHKIEEDPVSAERIRLIREAKEATLDYAENITRSRTQLEAGDSALAEANNIIVRAKEIGIAMHTDTISAEQRTIVAGEVQAMFESMVGLANTYAGGEYIFGGFTIDQRPFQTDGTFIGDTGQKQVDVGPFARLTVNLSGANAFTAAGGTDVFAEIDSLYQGLLANDMTAIGNAIDAMDVLQNQISTARTSAGLKLNQLDIASNVRDRIQDSLTVEESSLIDIDPVAVFMDLEHTTKSLQDALAVSQKVTNTSVLGSA